MTWTASLRHLIGPNSVDILWWQMSVRGVIAFFTGVLLVRVFGRRAFGELTPLDIIVAIVIGSNLSRALTANAPFFQTIVATTVIMALYWVLIHATARFRRLGDWLKGRVVWLARDGVVNERAMRHAGVGPGDLEESARRSGLADLDDLDAAALERSGKINVIPRRKEATSPPSVVDNPRTKR